MANTLAIVRNLMRTPLLPISMSVVTLGMSISSWVNYDMSRSMSMNNERLPSDRRCQHSTYDYIVVGSGAAGMVVATRLANASRDVRVLLLEAGGEPHIILNNVPVMDFHLMNQPPNTWVYQSTPQNSSCQSCDGKRTLTTRGKMLGGSTSINFMLYARGHKEDFNRWAIDAGDEQWNYENVFPYFKKSEDYHGAYVNSESSYKYHGRGGLLNVATYDYQPGVEDFLDAAREKGYTIGDYNAENQEVFSKIDVTTKNGWRESTYRAFYRDTGKPSNLCIKTYALVTKVNFAMKSNGPRAVGVTYNRHYLKRTVYATTEVILSAGTIESPKLLLLSGVGPSEHLNELNIPVIKDLPVGKNIQDRAYTLVGPFLKAPGLRPSTAANTENVVNLLLRGRGPLAAPAGFAGQGFLTSPQAEPAYPDLQTIQFSIALYPGIGALLNTALGLDVESLDEWFAPYNEMDTDARLVIILLGRPKSVGELTLASRNPRDNPNINPNYLTAPEDMEALLYGFKKIVDLYENTSALNTPLFRKPVPGCENERFKSDEYYRCVIRHISGSFYHHVGTCALGKVVDSRLRVIGIDGLRVIDASIIPRTPNANTQAATIMIGEKGADLILEDLFNRRLRRRQYG